VATTTTAPDTSSSQPPPVRRTSGFASRGTDSVVGVLVKVLGLGTVAGLVLYLTPVLLAAEKTTGLVAVWVAAAGLFAVYATRRLVPLKYLLPGTLFLLAMIVYPIIATIGISFTNFGDGKRLSKEEAVASIVGSSVTQAPDSTLYNLTVGTTGSATEGPFTFFLVQPETGTVYEGTPEDGLVELEGATVEEDFVTAVDGFTMLTPREVNDAGEAVSELAVPTDDGAIRSQGVRSAFEGVSSLSYDEATDTITDAETGQTYGIGKVGDSDYFVGDDGRPAFSQSWQQNVGLANYERVLTNDRIAGDFLRIFAWTLAFAVLNVGLTFLLGLALAVALNDPRIRGQKLYRSLLLLPYAIPGVIALLVWSNFYNRDFGLINTTLGLDLNWFGNEWLAKVAVLLTQLWMGFPYMFVICTGALQAIPSDLKEAASIDGANGFTAFRKVVFPLLLVAVAPLLVASFAFNFNNFNAIQLLTEGGPFGADNPTAGGTDILISYTFRLAFGASGAQFGFAAAISVLLFVITTVIAATQFRATRALEEVG
jgi:arabinogalactan oligomer/maltooligosaccharide transport system permease protein